MEQYYNCNRQVRISQLHSKYGVTRTEEIKAISNGCRRRSVSEKHTYLAPEEEGVLPAICNHVATLPRHVENEIGSESSCRRGGHVEGMVDLVCVNNFETVTAAVTIFRRTTVEDVLKESFEDQWMQWSKGTSYKMILGVL
ncbi:hypothetical protein OBBRIDRAFT_825025 [Obba rivulosa]|uniref:Uncharacterized protein n=1 Tax=Obba rivulosa TaxID=1052685 RepID=A0A8E2B4Z7_9APHY|nr:hypothetical protein OBBRIDRAFT_825025 [Obba rivulosa]